MYRVWRSLLVYGVSFVLMVVGLVFGLTGLANLGILVCVISIIYFSIWVIRNS